MGLKSVVSTSSYTKRKEGIFVDKPSHPWKVTPMHVSRMVRVRLVTRRLGQWVRDSIKAVTVKGHRESPSPAITQRHRWLSYGCLHSCAVLLYCINQCWSCRAISMGNTWTHLGFLWVNNGSMNPIGPTDGCSWISWCPKLSCLAALDILKFAITKQIWLLAYR